MKRITICTDGTWNSPDQKHNGKSAPSNVVEIARAISPKTTDGTAQITYYDTGVGTGTITDKVIGGITGKGLSDNIIEAYRFLSHNYSPGDELFLFGFSRGAYTARSLAGLINKMGIIPKRNMCFMDEIYALYKKHGNDTEVEEFKNKHECEATDIKFLGAWDTVGALGIPTRFLGMLTREKYTFHDVSLSPCVKNGYHAIGVDERRKPFAPTLWDSTSDAGQHIEQRWFSGVHTNIGGGYEDGGLSNIALHWMANKAKSHGLALDDRFLEAFVPSHTGTLYESKKWYYVGSNVRKLFATENGHEVLDATVCKRITELADYAPENIEAARCEE